MHCTALAKKADAREDRQLPSLIQVFPPEKEVVGDIDGQAARAGMVNEATMDDSGSIRATEIGQGYVLVQDRWQSCM